MLQKEYAHNDLFKIIDERRTVQVWVENFGARAQYYGLVRYFLRRGALKTPVDLRMTVDVDSAAMPRKDALHCVLVSAFPFCQRKSDMFLKTHIDLKLSRLE